MINWLRLDEEIGETDIWQLANGFDGSTISCVMDWVGHPLLSDSLRSNELGVITVSRSIGRMAV
jgi:hypothetical protein